MSQRYASLLLFALLATGCTAGTHSSGVKVEPYPIGAADSDPLFQKARAANAQYDKEVTGIRYYQRSPYLLVYSDGKGGIIWDVLYLPDPTKKSAIDFNVATSKFETTLNFENGTLKEFSDVGDSTALPLAVLTAVEEVLPAIVKMAFSDIKPGSATQPAEFPAPHLYKIVVAGNTVTFRGGEGDVPVRLQNASSK